MAQRKKKEPNTRWLLKLLPERGIIWISLVKASSIAKLSVNGEGRYIPSTVADTAKYMESVIMSNLSEGNVAWIIRDKIWSAREGKQQTFDLHLLSLVPCGTLISCPLYYVSFPPWHSWVAFPRLPLEVRAPPDWVLVDKIPARWWKPQVGVAYKTLPPRTLHSLSSKDREGWEPHMEATRVSESLLGGNLPREPTPDHRVGEKSIFIAFNH